MSSAVRMVHLDLSERMGPTVRQETTGPPRSFPGHHRCTSDSFHVGRVIVGGLWLCILSDGVVLSCGVNAVGIAVG